MVSWELLSDAYLGPSPTFMIELLCKNINKDFDMVLNTSLTLILTGDALRGFVPFVQFKKREKSPWRSVTFSNKS